MDNAWEDDKNTFHVSTNRVPLYTVLATIYSNSGELGFV